jgi:hypothetical protein
VHPLNGQAYINKTEVDAYLSTMLASYSIPDAALSYLETNVNDLIDMGNDMLNTTVATYASL